MPTTEFEITKHPTEPNKYGIFKGSKFVISKPTRQAAIDWIIAEEENVIRLGQYAEYKHDAERGNLLQCLRNITREHMRLLQTYQAFDKESVREVLCVNASLHLLEESGFKSDRPL